MKRLLILTDWFEPAFKAGGPVRSCTNLAQAMSDTYEVFVLTGDRDFGDSQPFQNIVFDQWIEFQPGVKVFYLSEERQTFKGIKEAILLATPDILYLNSMYSVNFTLKPLLLHLRHQISGKLFLAPRGMLHAGALQYKSIKKKAFLLLFRIFAIEKRIHWHATDQQEMQDIKRVFPKAANISLISNLPVSEQAPFESLKKEKGLLRIAFISRISPKKNLDYLLRALQSVKSSIFLEIAGPIESEAYWKNCQELIDKLPTNIKTSYLGAADQQEVVHILKKNHIFVLPTHGENFGHGIFESLVVGKPVVISHLTPWQDLQERHAGLLCVLDDARDLAKQIEHFAVQEDISYTVWAKGAWDYANDFLRNADLPNQYNQMFRLYGG